MKTLKFFLLITFYLSNLLYSQTDTSSTTWILDKIDSIGGYVTSKLTEFPPIIETAQGKSLLFDGINKALLIKGNPLGNAQSFTIEMIFRPDSASIKTNVEQRYFHLRSSANDNRRILLELRILSKMRWTIDTFIKSESSNCTLIDDTTKANCISHPIGPWYHIALVYENGIMKDYVNGIQELSGQVLYVPIDNGQISIGARQDPRSWFKGAIRLIKFTGRALNPSEFIKFETTEVKNEVTIPNGFSLKQNYPNPFNPSTSINYQISKKSFVNLKIYNSLGREIATLVNEYQTAGNYSKEFFASANNNFNPRSQLTSGVYFYRLQTESFSCTKKMVLMK